LTVLALTLRLVSMLTKKTKKTVVLVVRIVVSVAVVEVQESGAVVMVAARVRKDISAMI